MLTKKDYCDYETCVALKDLGFKDSTEYYYANNGEYTTTHDNWHSEYTQCWSLYEAQKWLREKKQMILLPAYLERANVWICEICYRKERLGFGGYNQSYEEALSEGIKEAVNILKK